MAMLPTNAKLSQKQKEGQAAGETGKGLLSLCKDAIVTHIMRRHGCFKY